MNLQSNNGFPGRWQVFGLWSLVFGLWALGFGLWSLNFGLWALVFSLQAFAFRALGLVFGFLLPANRKSAMLSIGNAFNRKSKIENAFTSASLGGRPRGEPPLQEFGNEHPTPPGVLPLHVIDSEALCVHKKDRRADTRQG